MMMTQPCAPSSTDTLFLAQYCLTASTNARWLLSIYDPVN